MAYDKATQQRIETQFGNMFRSGPQDEDRIQLIYRAVTWSMGLAMPHVVRKKKSLEFIRKLLAYAEQHYRDAVRD